MAREERVNSEDNKSSGSRFGGLALTVEEKKAHTKILAKIAEIIQSCPHFGDWDWCNTHCELYKFCDQIVEVLNLSNIGKGEI